MKKLSWLILVVVAAVPCALYAQTEPTPSSSDLALPAMPHPITPVPEIGRIWAPSPPPQAEGFGLGAPITEKGLEVPSPTPQVEVPVLSTPSPSPVSSAPEVSPTVAPTFAGVVLAMGKTTPRPKVELDTTLGGLEGFNGE